MKKFGAFAKAALVMAVLPLLLVASQKAPVEAREPAVSYANPAAVYCQDLGYMFALTETVSGQQGICKFNESAQCDAWDFLNGKCGQEYSICARQGYGIETRADGKNMFSQEYAVCVGVDGGEKGSVAVLADLERRSTEGCGDKAEEMPFDSEASSLPEVVEETGPVEGLPASYDWRSSNKLTSVRDQGNCGSCWAFSAVGAMEAALNIANNTTGNSYNLSEQYLVSDCHSVSGYQTCCGGWKDLALVYIKNSGIPDEACMPYVDGSGCSCNGGTCDTNCTYRTSGKCSDRTCSQRCSNYASRLVKIASTGKVSSARETIKSNLISKGPLAVSLRMSGSFDSNGVYRCSPDSPTNHAVVIVGYNNAGSYWIVRNSWGPGWNGDGYFKVGYGECSIENYVYYAKAASTTKPTLVAPAGTITDRTPTFKWNKVSGATQYRFQVYRGTTLLYTKTVPASACGTTQCANTPPTILQYAAHKWRAQAAVGGVWKPYSAYKNFTVSAPATGFNSTFNGSAAGWSSVRGAWNVYVSKYYRSIGLADKGASAKHTGTYGNFTYEARMKRSGVCTSCSNRLIIRGNPNRLDSTYWWEPSYVFQYTNTGSFSVYEMSSTGVATALKPWTSSSAIVKNGWNNLKVIANGNLLKFYINNVLVWSGSDPTLKTGTVGLGFFRYSDAGQLLVDWAKLAVGAPDAVPDAAEEVAPGIELLGGTLDQSPEVRP